MPCMRPICFACQASNRGPTSSKPVHIFVPDVFCARASQAFKTELLQPSCVEWVRFGFQVFGMSGLLSLCTGVSLNVYLFIHPPHYSGFVVTLAASVFSHVVFYDNTLQDTTLEEERSEARRAFCHHFIVME